MRNKAFLILIYNHPEYYPPTLNAVDQLSGMAESVIIITRNNKFPSWEYPENVEIFPCGDFVSIRESEVESTWWKIKSFFNFTWKALRLYRKYRPEWVLCYDSIPLLSARIMKWFSGIPFRLWYHNHDVSEIGSARKFSIGWFSSKSEQSFFSQIDLFTLPSRERTGSFNLGGFKGSLFVIPNYPSQRRYVTSDTNVDVDPFPLRIIFQGFIGKGHGLEEMIDYVSRKEGIVFTIIGQGETEYIKQLKELVGSKNLAGRVFIRDAVPYQLLLDVTRLHHLGLAIHKPLNIQYSTAALASNKIYEYAACGLAVMYFDDPHYKAYLSRYSWAFANDLSYEKLDEQCNFIREHYQEVSSAAEKDFREKLNFERVFCPVREFLLGEVEVNDNRQ